MRLHNIQINKTSGHAPVSWVRGKLPSLTETWRGHVFYTAIWFTFCTNYRRTIIFSFRVLKRDQRKVKWSVWKRVF